MSRIPLAALAATAAVAALPAAPAAAAAPSTMTLPVYDCQAVPKPTAFFAQVSAPHGWRLSRYHAHYNNSPYPSFTLDGVNLFQRGPHQLGRFLPPVMINITASIAAHDPDSTPGQQARADGSGEYAERSGIFSAPLRAPDGAATSTIVSGGWSSSHLRRPGHGADGENYATAETLFSLGSDPSHPGEYDYVNVTVDAYPNVRLTARQASATVAAVSQITRTIRLGDQQPGADPGSQIPASCM